MRKQSLLAANQQYSSSCQIRIIVYAQRTLQPVEMYCIHTPGRWPLFSKNIKWSNIPLTVILRILVFLLSFMIESRYDHLNSSCDKGSKSANNCQNHYISTLVYLMNIYLILSPCYIGSIMDSKKREQQISNVFSFYKQLLDIPIKVYSTSLLCLFLSLSLSNDASTYENDLYAIYIQLFPSNESKPSTIENMKSFRDKLIIVYLVVYDLKSNRVIRSIKRFILMIERKRRAWLLLCSKRNTTVLIMMYFLYVLLCIPNEWSYRDILQSTSTLSFTPSNHVILLIENKIVFVLFL